MRVITGSAKGHELKAPRRLGLRPTPSRVKEAIFSSFAKRIPRARILDLFSGTGAFSIEALSQGAATATMVEKDRHAAALIEKNLQKTHLRDRARLIRGDVRQVLEWLDREGTHFDLIFADPPYLKGVKPDPNRDPSHAPSRHPSQSFSWMEFLLHSAPLARLMAPDAILLIEHFKKEEVMESPLFVPRTQDRSQFRFGDTVVDVFVRHPSVREPASETDTGNPR